MDCIVVNTVGRVVNSTIIPKLRVMVIIIMRNTFIIMTMNWRNILEGRKLSKNGFKSHHVF